MSPRRPAPRRAVAGALAAALPLLLGACSSVPLLNGPGANASAADRRGVLACAGEVAAEQGLEVAPLAAPAASLQLASAPAEPPAAAVRAAAAGAPPMRDVLTVGFGEPAALPAAGAPRPSASRLRHALRVAAQSFRLQLDVEARGDAARTGAPAHAEWRPAPVSPRAAELRDLVLARCGTLGR